MGPVLNSLSRNSVGMQYYPRCEISPSLNYMEGKLLDSSELINGQQANPLWISILIELEANQREVQ